MKRRAPLRPKSRPARRDYWTAWLWSVLLLYLVAATMRYRFTHPEQTETELLLNLWEALTWR